MCSHLLTLKRGNLVVSPDPGLESPHHSQKMPHCCRWWCSVLHSGNEPVDSVVQMLTYVFWLNEQLSSDTSSPQGSNISQWIG